jgi:protein-tyrosine-phosphatase
MTETDTTPRVLFLCTHNAARGQMAEAFLRHYTGDRFEVLSTGLVWLLTSPLMPPDADGWDRPSRPFPAARRG